MKRDLELMTHELEPMTTFDDNEWRAYKRATRRLHRRPPLELVRDVEPRSWLQAVERDDLADPVEREPALEEQAA